MFFVPGISKASVSIPKPNMACVALYPEDGCWYRSQVISIHGSEVEILFVDYGNKTKVPLSDVKVIEEDLLVLPAQAYHCRLTAIQVPVSWTDADKCLFEGATFDKTLEASLIDCVNGRYEVVMTQVQEEGTGKTRVVINEMFGYPKYTDISTPLSDDYTSAPISNASNVDLKVSWFYHSQKFYLTSPELSCYEVLFY